MYESLVADGYTQVKLFGVGKDSHMSALSNWTGGNDASVVADVSPYLSWSEWDASQRDLYLVDNNQNIVFHENISGGIPSNFSSQVMDLIDTISDDCVCPGVYDPVCGADGNSYQNSCYAECENVEYFLDGEFDNTNPCNPRECVDGEWLEIVIDCEEQMGIPCEGGVYVAPPEEECCSTCVHYGDSNADGILNVLDVVILVNFILNPGDENLEVADMNSDGVVNVLDVVTLVNIILNP